MARVRRRAPVHSIGAFISPDEAYPAIDKQSGGPATEQEPGKCPRGVNLMDDALQRTLDESALRELMRGSTRVAVLSAARSARVRESNPNHIVWRLRAMLKKLSLLVVFLALTTPAFSAAAVSGDKTAPVSSCGKHCPKGEVRDYTCKPGTGPGSKDNKACVKVYGKCVPKEPAPK